MKYWNNYKKTLHIRTKRELKADIRPLRFPKFLDLVWIVIVLLATIALLIGWGLFVEFGDRYAWFDPPILRPVPDERILQNFRSETRPLLAATFHLPEKKLYIAQQGGFLHNYDPDTDLWRTINPFLNLRDIHWKNLALRSGCGIDPNSKNLSACPEPDSLWVLADKNTLARRSQGIWSVVIGDSAFVGRDGNKANTEDLTAAALSVDGRWLLLGTLDKGIGLYDQENRRWVTVSKKIQQNLPQASIKHLRWWKDRFWIGAEDGLGYLIPDEADLEGASHPSLDGSIVDLDAGKALFILEYRTCENGNAGCVRLSRLNSSNAKPQMLIDERNIYPELALERLYFAAQQSDILFLGGESGLFSYDTRYHRWEQLHASKLRATLRPDGADFFYAAFADGNVVQYEDGEKVQSWSLPTRGLQHLVLGQKNEVLALAPLEAIWTLKSNGSHKAIYRATATKLNPHNFTSAVLLGKEHILFTGPEGGLLHNVYTRLFRDFTKFPEWLQQKNIQMITSGNLVYAFKKSGTKLQFRVGKQSDWLNGNFQETMHWLAPSISAPVQNIRKWSNFGEISLIGGNGMVWQINAYEEKPLLPMTGPAISGFKFDADVNDVALTSKYLLAASNHGLRRYDLRTRHWSEWLGQNVDGGDVRELAYWKGKIFLNTASKRLARLNGTKSALIIGDDVNRLGFNFGDGGLSDVMQDGDLYLAGLGWVNRYNSQTRRIDKRWHLSNRGNVDLIDIQNGQPLTLNNGNAYLGSKPIDPSAGRVHSLFSGNSSIWSFFSGAKTIWTVREKSNSRYLKYYEEDKKQDEKQIYNTSCLMYNPELSGKNLKVTDARELYSGWFAVSTTQGLKFYSQNSRSWFHGTFSSLPKKTRLYILGNYLVSVTPKQGKTQTIRWTALDNIIEPASCAKNIKFSWDEVITVKAISVDEQYAKIAWIDKTNAVYELSNAGKSEKLLSASIGGPKKTSVRRIFQRSGYFYLTTDKAIFRYQLGNHEWTRYDWCTGEMKYQKVSDIVLEPDSSKEEVVTVTRKNGHIYVGKLKPEKNQCINLIQIELKTGRFNASGKDILDVQNRGDGKWTFLLKDRIKFFDPKTRKWDEVILPKTSSSFRYGKAAGLDFITSDKDKVWWVKSDNFFVRHKLVPEEFTAIDSKKKIWSFNDKNAVLRVCEIENNSEYSCHEEITPIILEPTEVQAAYSLPTSSYKRLVLLQTSQGLRLIDTKKNKEFKFPRSVVRWNDIVELRQHNNSLWLLSKSHGLAQIWWNNNKAAAKTFPKAKAIRIDGDKDVWAKIKGQWRLFNNKDDKFELPKINKNKLPFIQVHDNLTTTAIDNKNRVFYRQSSSWEGKLSLPKDIDSSKIDTLFAAGTEDSFWVQQGSVLSHLTPSSSCSSDKPCLKVSGQVMINAPVIWLNTEKNLVKVITENGESIEIDPKINYQTKQIESELPKSKSIGINIWESLRKSVYKINGQHVFDPIIKLVLDYSNKLEAEHYSGKMTLLAEKADTTLQELPHLDIGWLRWNRDNKSFTVAGKQFKPTEFVRNRRLIIEDVNAVLAKSDGLWTANQFGVLHFPRNNLNLDDKNINFIPIELSSKIIAAHNRFLIPNSSLIVGETQFENENYSVHEVNLAYAVFRENVRQRQVTGQLTTTDKKIDVFQQSGFLWDWRKDLAFENGQLFLLSMAGIHSTGMIKNIDTGPNNAALRNKAEIRTDKNNLLLLGQNAWLQRTRNKKWTKIAGDPFADWSIVNNQIWRWWVEKYQLRVALKNSSQHFEFRQTPNKLYFTTDKLQAAAIYQNHIYLMTEGALELAKNIQGLAAGVAERFAPQASDRLDNYTGGLFRKNAGIVSIWDETKRLFSNISVSKNTRQKGDSICDVIGNNKNNPYRNRLLVNTNRLCFALYKNRLIKEIRVDDPLSKNTDWIQFNFYKQRMPFDVITGIEIWRNHLYLASLAGLQLYNNQLGLSNLTKLYDLSVDGQNLVAVKSLGSPDEDSEKLIVTSDKRCLENRGNGFTSCPLGTKIRRRFRANSKFWHWWQADNSVQGEYWINGGRRVQFTRGRFSHDQLIDVVNCQGYIAALRQDGVIMLHTGSTLSLKNSVQSFDLSSIIPKRFICLDQKIKTLDGIIEAGLYVAGDKTVYRFMDKEWLAETKPFIREELLSRAFQPPIFEKYSLRLIRDKQQGLVFKQQTKDKKWHTIQWQDGQLNIDAIKHLTVVGNRYWAVTNEGIVSFSINGNNKLVLNPKKLTIIRQLKDCPVTDFVTETKTFLRCAGDSKRVYSGNLQQDKKVFSLLEGKDPFVEATQVEMKDTNYWQWRLENRLGNSRGKLRLKMALGWKELRNGRFDFDRISALALLNKGWLELAADPGGWFLSPRKNAELAVLKRPQTSEVNINEVTAVNIQRKKQQYQLCLTLNQKKALLFAADKSIKPIEHCIEDAGIDKIWHYAQAGSKLIINTFQYNKDQENLRRVLKNGRFNDDRAKSFPATIMLNNKIHYLLPTPSGVLVLDRELNKQAISTSLNTHPNFKLANKNEQPVMPAEILKYFSKNIHVLTSQRIGSKLFIVVPKDVYEVDMTQLAPVKKQAEPEPEPKPKPKPKPEPEPKIEKKIEEKIEEKIEKPLNKNEIHELQTLLLAHGYDPKGIDGKFGKHTKAAIKNYQRDNNLPVDGKASRALLLLLNK